MSKFGKKLTKKEALELLIENGFAPEEAEQVVSESEQAEAEFFSEDKEKCLFFGTVNRKDYVISAFYVFGSEMVRDLGWYDLPWGAPDWYTIC